MASFSYLEIRVMYFAFWNYVLFLKVPSYFSLKYNIPMYKTIILEHSFLWENQSIFEVTDLMIIKARSKILRSCFSLLKLNEIVLKRA